MTIQQSLTYMLLYYVYTINRWEMKGTFLYSQGMEECVAKGLTRAIDISNFSITKTEKLLKTAKIVPAANQVELHAYFQQPKLREYCDSKGESGKWYVLCMYS